MVKIGVTGALGYLGSKVAMKLEEKGFDVVPVDNFSNNKIDELPGLEVKEADVSSLENVKHVFSDVDAIVHLAASSGLEACSEEPEEAFQNNIIATSNIAWFCRQNNIPLSFASSVAVFGTPEEFPITEDTPRHPTNLYGKTKLMGEEDIKRLSEGSYRSHIFNIANICGSHTIDGERVSRENVVEIFLQKALDGEDLTVYKPGTQSRDFIAVQDVARAFVLSVEKLLDSDRVGAERFLLATGESTSVLSLARIISDQLAERKIEPELIDNPRDSEVLAGDFSIKNNKLKDNLSLSVKYNLEATIRRSLEDIN